MEVLYHRNQLDIVVGMLPPSRAPFRTHSCLYSVLSYADAKSSCDLENSFTCSAAKLIKYSHSLKNTWVLLSKTLFEELAIHHVSD